MRRREFITLLGGAAAWPLAARAQPTGKLPIIGFLGTNTASAQRQWTDAFLQRLRELGWIEGRTIAIEYRWADGRLERSAEIVAELVRLKVDVIVTHSAEPVLAAKRETAVIPIIFPVVGDPVGSGVVASLTRPDGNATGLSLQATDRILLAGGYLTGAEPDAAARHSHARLDDEQELLTGIDQQASDTGVSADVWDGAQAGRHERDAFGERDASGERAGRHERAAELSETARGGAELGGSLAADELAGARAGLGATAPVSGAALPPGFVADETLPVAAVAGWENAAGTAVTGPEGRSAPRFPDGTTSPVLRLLGETARPRLRAAVGQRSRTTPMSTW